MSELDPKVKQAILVALELGEVAISALEVDHVRAQLSKNRVFRDDAEQLEFQSKTQELNDKVDAITDKFYTAMKTVREMVCEE
jgi:hypothetical protein